MALVVVWLAVLVLILAYIGVAALMTIPLHSLHLDLTDSVADELERRKVNNS